MRFVTAEARLHVVRAAVVYMLMDAKSNSVPATLTLSPPHDFVCADDDAEVYLLCCYLRPCRFVSVMQARIAEYFGVSEALIAARGAQNRINRSEEEEKEEGNLLQAMKKKADESHAE
jgi:hypothetical protein